MNQTIIVTANESEQRLDRFLRKYLTNVSLSDIYKIIRKSRVKVNGKKAKENYRLIEGDSIEISISDISNIDSPKENVEKIDKIHTNTNLTIIYEDKNILLIDKDTGTFVHSDKTHKENTLISQVIYYLYKSGEYNPEEEITFRPAAVNRLDVNTGGIIIFAKNYASLKELNELIRERRIEKKYISVIKGKMDKSGELRGYITKDEVNNISQISDNKGNKGKEVCTKYKCLKSNGEYSLVEIELITGRSHQIRAHLSSIGHPIIGDMKYGDRNVNNYFRKEFGIKNQLLYAHSIGFGEIEGDLSYLSGKSFFSNLPIEYLNVIKKVFDYSIEQ